ISAREKTIGESSARACFRAPLRPGCEPEHGASLTRLFSRARGAKPTTPHGPLQRLLEGLFVTGISHPPKQFSKTFGAKEKPQRNSNFNQVVHHRAFELRVIGSGINVKKRIGIQNEGR